MALVLVGLPACGDDPVAPPGPDEVPAAVSPARAWPGAVITVEWEWLAGRAETPVFTVGDSAVQYVRADDRRVWIVVPHVVAGPVTVTALVDGTPVPLGTVEVFGWARVDPLPWLAANRPWPSAAGTEMIGIDTDDGSLQVVDLASGAQRGTGPLPFRGTIDEVGLSYREGVAIIHEHDHETTDPTLDWARLWRIDPVPERLDSVWTGAALNNLLELGPDRFLNQHNGDTWSSGFPSFWEEETGTGAIVPSPTWDRILLFHFAGPAGVYLLDTATGAPAYRLSDFELLAHGAFTADGAEAFLVVLPREDPETSRLIRINAATGDVLAEADFPPNHLYSTRVALAGNRVLVAYDGSPDDRWHLRVLRAGDLSLEVDLPLPDPAVSGWWVNPVLAAAPDGSAAFLVTSTGQGAWRHRIELLPE
jgi:hypothetical protein